MPEGTQGHRPRWGALLGGWTKTRSLPAGPPRAASTRSPGWAPSRRATSRTPHRPPACCGRVPCAPTPASSPPRVRRVGGCSATPPKGPSWWQPRRPASASTSTPSRGSPSSISKPLADPPRPEATAAVEVRHRAGRHVAELDVPGEIKAIEVSRGGHAVIPSTTATFNSGDLVSFVVAAGSLGRLRSFLGGRWQR